MELYKLCKTCNVVKHHSLFTRRGYHCKACHCSNMKKYYESHPDARRISNIKSNKAKKQRYKDTPQKIINPNSTKYCIGCNQYKTLICFYRHKLSYDGLQSKCKDCISIYMKQHREKLNKLSLENKFILEFDRELMENFTGFDV